MGEGKAVSTRPLDDQNSIPLTFTVFPKLPMELQLRIWKLTIPGPRVVSSIYFTTLPQFRERNLVEWLIPLAKCDLTEMGYLWNEADTRTIRSRSRSLQQIQFTILVTFPLWERMTSRRFARRFSKTCRHFAIQRGWV